MVTDTIPLGLCNPKERSKAFAGLVCVLEDRIAPSRPSERCEIRIEGVHLDASKRGSVELRGKPRDRYVANNKTDTFGHEEVQQRDKMSIARLIPIYLYLTSRPSYCSPPLL